tara:strand:- start:22748 stop:23758 length:1011 start_codon:yes stop_codon:yes gene_type:complete
MKVLGIESSCDDTGVAIYDTQQGLLGDLIYSQLTHRKYGGVVPELASRDHIQKVLPLIDALLTKCELSADQIDGIAFTQGPGLAGALMVGATVAQGLRLAWNVPAIGIHHLEGHLLAAMLAETAPTFPFLALLVSGGHTQLIAVEGLGQYEILGESLDDAVGEAFDKTAKLMGLPYPGGPVLAQKAENGDPKRFCFPRPLLKRPDLNFSFSGLKTHVAKLIQESTLDEQTICDIAAQFEETVSEILVTKVGRAMAQTGYNRLVVSGGVAANLTLRRDLTQLGHDKDFAVFFPPLKYCTDNGAMIAHAGALRLERGEISDYSIQVRPRWPLDSLSDI